jgi:hypothetical protein
MHLYKVNAQWLARRCQRCSREIAVALALTIAAGALLFATLIDGAPASRPVVASSVLQSKM